MGPLLQGEAGAGGVGDEDPAVPVRTVLRIDVQNHRAPGGVKDGVPLLLQLPEDPLVLRLRLERVEMCILFILSARTNSLEIHVIFNEIHENSIQNTIFIIIYI